MVDDNQALRYCIIIRLEVSHDQRLGEAVPVDVRRVEGLEGLLREVLLISNDMSPDTFLWYRGHTIQTYSLIPGIMRDGKGQDAVFERERRLITRFRQRSIAYWPAGYPQSDWEQLFAMQHFGVPTRLLDWSENLFVAAHFALSDLRFADNPDIGPPVVWCLDPVNWNRSTSVLSDFGDTIHVMTTSDDEIESYRPDTIKKRNKSPIAIFGTHNSNRIVAQRGTFMVWGNDVRSLESFAEESAARVWKLEIDGDRKLLARKLSLLGFSETMVFPELTYLASELTRTEGWRA
jgi:hypothetical protein